MIELTASSGGCQFSVKARPGGKRDAVVGEHGGALKVTVTAPPENGKANQAIVRLLAEQLGVAAGRVAIVRGVTNSAKVVRVEGMDAESLKDRLTAILGKEQA